MPVTDPVPDPVPDVVVTGYGPAGAAAALAAHDAGDRVLILESTDHGGGNCPHSGGNLFDAPSAPGSPGGPGARFLDHLSALCFGQLAGRHAAEFQPYRERKGPAS